MRYHAVLVLDGGHVQGCTLSDISDTGARIDIETAEELPDHFTLLLSGNGAPQRKCRVVWRQPTQIGVNFEMRLPPHERVSLVPHMGADFPAEGHDATPAKVSE